MITAAFLVTLSGTLGAIGVAVLALKRAPLRRR
jgi:hypothetical protein